MSTLLDNDVEGKEKPKSQVRASLLSALSGNPDSKDYKHNRIRNMVDNGRFARNISAFSIPVEGTPDGVAPYDTTWVKSPHGAYVLVRTRLPLNYKGDMQDVPGYAVMFSQHPNFLARLFLWKDKEGIEKPSKEEIEAKLTVVAARYEHDVLQTNPKTGDQHIVTAWMKTSVDRHTATFSRLLKRHGSIIRDGDNLLRSGSSILWARPTKQDPDKYDCFYYANPVFGQVSLFMNEASLNSSWSQILFKPAAVKLNDEPLTKEDADKFSHSEFTRISRKIMQLEDPYDLDSSAKMFPKIGRAFKKGIVRTVQKMTHSITNINLKALFVTTGVSGFLMFVLHAPALLFAATAGKSQFLLKSVQTITRAGAKFLSPVSTLAVNSLNDVSVLLASHVKNNYVTDEVRGLIANSNFVEHMHAMPCEFMANTYPDIVTYDQEHEREWARAVILDTLGIQPGTIFSEVELHGRDFLKAEQPNGLDIYYDPEELVAFAHQVRDPYEHTCLETPIQLILSELTPRRNFIGVRLGKEGRIEQRNFQSMKRIPKEFNKSRANSIQALESTGMNLDDLKSEKEFPLLDVLPPKVAEKIIKKSMKEFTAHFKAAVNKGMIPDLEGGLITVDHKVEAYITKREHDGGLSVTNVFEDAHCFVDRLPCYAVDSILAPVLRASYGS